MQQLFQIFFFRQPSHTHQDQMLLWNIQALAQYCLSDGVRFSAEAVQINPRRNYKHRPADPIALQQLAYLDSRSNEAICLCRHPAGKHGHRLLPKTDAG